MRELGYTINFHIKQDASYKQIQIDYKVINEDAFVPFDCSRESLMMFKDIYSNGINVL